MSTINPDPAQLSLFTGSDSCITLAQGWPNSCLASHARCGGWDSQTLPTRLLDVSDSIAQGSIRLVLEKEIPVKTPYFTLSYCWGRTKPVVLTTLSLSTFRASTDNTLLWDCPALEAFDSSPNGKRVAENRHLDLNLHWELRSLLHTRREYEGTGKAYDKLLSRLSWMLAKYDPASTDWEDTFQDNWHTIARLYSNCQLTVSSDKKLALAGIVQWIQREQHMRYIEVFWCWATLVPQQLLWASDRIEPLARPVFIGAPSCSWLSVDDGIVFPVRVPHESDPTPESGAASRWVSCCTVNVHPDTNNNQPESSDPTDKTVQFFQLRSKLLGH